MHAIVQNHLEKMLENRLPHELRNQVESHLTSCADCRSAYEEALETSRLVKLLASDDAPEPAPGFSIKVMESIQASRAASRSWLYFPALRELGFATAMFLMLLGGYYLTVRAADRTTSAEFLVDMPGSRVVSVSATHQHRDPSSQSCALCWHQKHGSAPQAATQVAKSDDDHARRESVFASLASTELGD